MLKSIDILIGFAVTMLAGSMAVTVLTQIWTNFFELRALHLRDGLAGLLQALRPEVSPAEAKTLTSSLLVSPTIQEGAGRMGTWLHPDEFARLLPTPPPDLEKHFLRAVARVRARFMRSTHRIALLSAFAVAAGCQLDSVALLKRLATDESFRSAHVARAATTETQPAISLLSDREPWNVDRIPGILLSTLLLSLGAPFWFEAMNNLLKLRGSTLPSADVKGL